MEREEGREQLEATRSDVALLLSSDDAAADELDERLLNWTGWSGRKPVPAFDALIVELWVLKDAAVKRAAQLREAAAPYLRLQSVPKKRRALGAGRKRRDAKRPRGDAAAAAAGGGGGGSGGEEGGDGGSGGKEGGDGGSGGKEGGDGSSVGGASSSGSSVLVRKTPKQVAAAKKAAARRKAAARQKAALAAKRRKKKK